MLASEYIESVLNQIKKGLERILTPFIIIYFLNHLISLF